MLDAKKSLSVGLTSIFLVGSSLAAVGCGPIAFTDDTSIVITGNPPPPPPPPPKPVVKAQRVVVTADAIEIKEKIQFAYNDAEILESSFSLLEEIKGVILEHDEIKKISVEGHTDSDGNDRYNQDLSERRAASVVKYLVEHGVAEERLAAVGYGESKPLVEETSDADKETNRRVEFHITEQDERKIEYDVDPATGERKAVAPKG